MIDTKQMLAKAIETGASDVHINIGMPPIMRINTELLMMDLPEVSNDDAGKMILEMIGEDKFKKFRKNRLHFRFVRFPIIFRTSKNCTCLMWLQS
ncbi:MAG: hypothetical protein ACYSUS_06280 [Planctomycetota bacterium]|jgi:twitching motility protein PilT